MGRTSLHSLAMLAATIAVAIAPRFASADGVAPAPLTGDEQKQLGWCMDPKTIAWKPGDTPSPLDRRACAPLISRAVCLRIATSGATREQALGVRATLEPMVRTPVSAAALVMAPTLDTARGEEVRAAGVALQCADVALGGAELAAAKVLETKASGWADAYDRALSAEQSARESVVGAVCSNDMLLEQARAAMARERANPSGYVDAALLHKLGGDVQYYQEQLAALSPQYVAVRRHPFQGWRTEGACVALRESQ